MSEQHWTEMRRRMRDTRNNLMQLMAECDQRAREGVKGASEAWVSLHGCVCDLDQAIRLSDREIHVAGHPEAQGEDHG